MTAENEPPALACHLDAAHYQERTRRFADLNRKFLLKSQRMELGLELTYSSNASDELRELMRLEQECCPFLDFQLESGGSSVKLSLMAPESARDFIDALLEPFLTT